MARLVWAETAKFKKAQLQHIATLIGTPLTGTRDDLRRSITRTLASMPSIVPPEEARYNWSVHPQPLRVLSIDMGIRNLAYAFLTCNIIEASSRHGFPVLGIDRPILRNWQRKDFHGPNGDAGKEVAAAKDAMEVQYAGLKEKGSFEPRVMAEHAYHFAKFCVGLNPTHILIERQRFRSAGHSAVLEWSLRVGVLEGMLHVAFKTFIEEGQMTVKAVESLLPMRVNKFWLKDRDVPATGTQAKQAKIALVKEMLRNADDSTAAFTVQPQLQHVADGFALSTKKFRGRKSGVDKTNAQETASSKLDDLSDSLLQGLAWLRWQDNRLKANAEGTFLNLQMPFHDMIKNPKPGSLPELWPDAPR